jgi:hypothetical protein
MQPEHPDGSVGPSHWGYIDHTESGLSHGRLLEQGISTGDSQRRPMWLQVSSRARKTCRLTSVGRKAQPGVGGLA